MQVWYPNIDGLGAIRNSGAVAGVEASLFADRDWRRAALQTLSCTLCSSKKSADAREPLVESPNLGRWRGRRRWSTRARTIIFSATSLEVEKGSASRVDFAEDDINSVDARFSRILYKERVHLHRSEIIIFLSCIQNSYFHWKNYIWKHVLLFSGCIYLNIWLWVLFEPKVG